MDSGPVKRSFRRNSLSRGHFAIGCATVKFVQATRVVDWPARKGDGNAEKCMEEERAMGTVHGAKGRREEGMRILEKGASSVAA